MLKCLVQSVARRETRGRNTHAISCYHPRALATPPSSQVLLEKRQRALPGQLGGGFVVAGDGIVVLEVNWIFRGIGSGRGISGG
jgi:hypothetical protein